MTEIPYWLQCIIACALFTLGIRLSAFFNGSEIGFYRLSIPRLEIDSRAGENKASRLLWFANRPAYFVGTCLIGNNFANYLSTAALSSGTILLFGKNGQSVDVAVTLVMAPFIFEFGELLPKSVYYMVPFSSLKRNIRWLRIFYFVFLPISWPLVQLVKFFEQLRGTNDQTPEIQMGRNRLVQLMQHGHREGVLTDLQSRLANGLLQLAPQPLLSSVIPSTRVLGTSDQASRKEMLEFARKFGVSAVAVHHDQDETSWYGYAFVAELLMISDELPLVHPMPKFSVKTSKLEALHRLQVADANYGVVVKNGKTLGIVARNGLVEQIFRPVLNPGGRIPAGS